MHADYSSSFNKLNYYHSIYRTTWGYVLSKIYSIRPNKTVDIINTQKNQAQELYIVHNYTAQHLRIIDCSLESGSWWMLLRT